MNALSTDPVLDEIRRLHDDRQSGTVSLNCSSNNGRIDIFLREGLIEAASSNLQSFRLGDYLRKQLQIAAGDLDAAQSEAQRRKIWFGEAVVRRKLADQARVRAAARCQAMELLAYAVNNCFSVGSFTASLRSYYAPARISFPHVLLELYRSNAALFEPQARTEIALCNGVDASAFPWYPQELCVLTHLENPNTFDGLLTATGLGEASLKKILGVLHKLAIIEILSDRQTSNAVVKRSEFRFEQLIPVITGAVLHEKLEVPRNGSSFTSEQFKNLKVQVNENTSKDPLKVFTVSSPEAQDGKSLISANLAFSFAMDPGRRVVLIDCDLRRPSLQNYLGVPSEPGLLQYLTDGHFNPYCYLRRIDNLYFLTSGGVAENPIEILSMEKMKQLIEYLKIEFDTIILDAAPYSPIADARIVTGLSDGLIMVVRRGKTSYRSTDRALKAIDRNKLIGVVFNDVKPMLFHTYQDFGYYRYSGDKLAYATNDSKTQATPKKYLES
jgi:capsular exopolysaccharide synthesis family protein